MTPLKNKHSKNIVAFWIWMQSQSLLVLLELVNLLFHFYSRLINHLIIESILETTPTPVSRDSQ